MAVHLLVSSLWWNKATRDTGRVALELRLARLPKRPDRKNYPIDSDVPGYHFAGPNHLEHVLTAINRPSDEAEARRSVVQTARRLQFRDITGLQPTRDRVPEISGPLARRMLPDAHHWKFWYDPRTHRYVMTDEPHSVGHEMPQPDRVAWADRAGCIIATSKWGGMYWPEGGTRLELISHRETGAPLERLLYVLAEAPPPVLETTAVWHVLSAEEDVESRLGRSLT